MSDFVTLTCPACGGKLQITNDIERFACAHCGAEHVVRRGGGLVSLAPVVAEIKHVGAGVDRTASELAIQRLTNEIAELERMRGSISTELTVGTGWTFSQSVGIALGGIALVLFALLLIDRTRPGAEWFFGAAVVLGGVGAFLTRNYNKDLERRAAAVRQETTNRHEERVQLDQQIASKMVELRKHQELVSM